MVDYQCLIASLGSLLGAAAIAPDSPLYLETVALCRYLEQPTYRIAVFAPFNHGKSTLLNALLSSKTLPMDLIPTTGAGIIIRYGADLTTEITLQDGQKISESGSQILSQYAVLDQDRRMKREVLAATVTFPHPWLKTGVELLDLPGTNDRTAQNDLVKHQLLSADLVIHVLDSRKLMTLEEREHLTHWLKGRGIANVVFVVNFLNLLTPEEQQQVRHRVALIAESFPSELPGGISNVFFVDALPALRARLKEDRAAAQATGIISLESALQTITSQQNPQHKLSRITTIAELLLEQAIAKQKQLEESISIQQAKSAEQIKIKQKAAQLIQQGFNRTISDFRGWLYLPQLLSRHQPDLAIALQQNQFEQWNREFQSAITQYEKEINKWIKQAGEFFSLDSFQLLAIDCPSCPTIQIPQSIVDPPPVAKADGHAPRESSQLNHLLAGKIGTVVLGSASYILHKVAPPSSTNPQNSKINTPINPPEIKISSQTYVDAATAYLKSFSDRANNQLTQYEQLAQEYITFTPQPPSLQPIPEDYQLQLLRSLIANLTTELINLNRA